MSLALATDQIDRTRPTSWRKFLIALRKSKAGATGLVIVILIVLMAIFASYLTPENPMKQSLSDRLTPPAWGLEGLTHVLGTDALGRDILSRILVGSRISLVISISAVVIGGLIGTLVGLVSGFYGGRLDNLMMRLADIQLALPSLVLYLAILVVLGPSLRNVILGLGVTSWVSFARIVRSEVLSLRSSQFVESARSVGQSNAWILFRHIAPNVINSVVVLSTLLLGEIVLAEASLSFLGIGVPPSNPTWGGMIADGRSYVEVAWWISTIPGIAILITVMGFNLFGDWLRDYWDPRLRD